MTIRTNSSKYFLYKFTFFIFFKLSQKHVVEIGKKKNKIELKTLKILQAQKQNLKQR